MKRVVVFLTLFLMFASVHASDCKDRLFTLGSSGEDGVSTMDILTQLASTCNFAISTKDAKSALMLNTAVPPFSLSNIAFDELLNIFISEKNLSYEYTGNLLKISYYVTKTFKLNYIGTSRKSSSSTSISISGSGNSGDSFSSSGSSSSVSGDMQGGSGETTTEITTTDENRFWSEIENELTNIVFDSVDINSTTRDKKVIVNKNAGLITVKGTADEIAAAQKYINEVEKNIQTSVMIDVSILKVALSNSESIGIDWDQLLDLQNVGIQFATSGLFNQHSGGTPDGLLPDDITYPSNTDSGELQSVVNTAGSVDKNFGYSIVSTGVTFNRLIDFLEKYGDVSSVSNPKVITLNNQPALISVGEIIRYKQTRVYQVTGDGNPIQNTEDTYPSVFAGILLDITPSIDDDDEIILKINPSITDTKGDVSSVALSAPPNLTTNQLSSIVRAHDGEKIIIGGLIKKDRGSETKKVPVLGDIPILGYAFKREESTVATEELVIVITAHIVGGSRNGISLKDLGYEKIDKNGMMAHENNQQDEDTNNSNPSQAIREGGDGQI